MIAYAGDTLLLIEIKFKQGIESKAYDTMNLLITKCERVNMQISAEKTTYALMKETLQRDHLIRADNQTIQR